MDPKTYELTALTDIWTGDINGKSKRPITTGLLGSIRWWFEVLVRGLGGAACDPSAKSKSCQNDEHCVVCELFGCTGWGRKFRFDVLDDNDRPPDAQLKMGTKFKLRFTPLRPIREEEWAMLDLTLRLIADYGAMGGKTVYKPTAEQRREDATHHQDHGVVTIHLRPDVPWVGKAGVERYVTRDVWRRGNDEGYAWASLEHFWFVDRRLGRTTGNSSPFNRVIGRKEPKSQAQQLVENSDTNRWLAGSTGKSKKVFSFKNPARTFGFVRPGTISHQEMKKRLEKVWSDVADSDYYQAGLDILDNLLAATEVDS
jgi:CRISPR-associated protein Cmr1